MTELDLFSMESHPARRTDPATSHQGARVSAPRRGSKREKAFLAYCEWHPEPISNEELYRRWPEEREDVIRPRVAELKKALLVVAKGVKPGSRGTDIEVCGLTPKGLYYAKEWGYL